VADQDGRTTMSENGHQDFLAPIDEDVEAHRVPRIDGPDEDDVEGHVQPPRGDDTDHVHSLYLA
jgi:hypothetical protein